MSPTLPQDLAAARESRRAALVTSWAAGKRLTGSELAEIADLIGQAGGPTAFDDHSSGDSEPAGAVELDPTTRIGETRSTYARRLEDYAEVFGRSKRVIKGWIAIGRAAPDGPDLPPLDNPPAMLTWWRRRMKNKPPDRFLAFEGKEGEGAPQKKETRPAAAPVALEGVGFAAELDRLREMTRSRAGQLEAAEAGGDPLEIELATSRYERSLKLLREFERDAEKVGLARGDLFEVAQAEEILRQKNLALRQRLRTLLRRLEDARIFDAPTFAERDAIFQKALDVAFSECAATGFRPVVVEDAFDLAA